MAPGNISKICSARSEKLKIFLRFFGTWKYFKDLFSAFREAENIFKIFWHLEIFQRFVQRVQRSWKYFKKFFGALRAPGNISKICSARLEKLEIFKKIFWHLEISQRCVQRVQRSWKYFKKFFGALKAPGNISKTCSARLEKLEIF